MKVNIYNQEGEVVGEIDLPSEFFEVPFNNDLVWQVFVSQMANQRKPIAHTKDRGEVRGGGRKPWPQKGTGRARHGSIRSPLWVGGGITFGPRKEKKYEKRIPKKMKRKALLSVLSEKLRKKLLFILDKIKIEKAKTKEVDKILKNLREKIKEFQKGSVIFVVSKKDPSLKRAARNIPDLEIVEAKDLNILTLLSFKYVFLTKDSIKVIQEKFKLKKKS